MSDQDINYVKEVFKSDINLGFIGVMAFLMLVVSFWGFLPLLFAGEIAALFLAQNSRVQRLIRSRLNRHKALESVEAEVEIVKNLPGDYQAEYNSVRHLCEEIERRSLELDASRKNILLSGMIEKLSSFRYDYARMLRARYLLSTRNYRNLETVLKNQIDRAKDSIEREKSAQVRQALAQNLSILTQRQDRVRKLDELVRLLDARQQTIKNSLSLIQDEVYSFTDVSGITGMVDNLLTTIKISDDFRTTFNDVLAVELPSDSITEFERELSAQADDSERDDDRRPPRERLRRVK
jgi:hypothetical protein